jgi:hypothetical protein
MVWRGGLKGWSVGTGEGAVEMDDCRRFLSTSQLMAAAV